MIRKTLILAGLAAAIAAAALPATASAKPPVIPDFSNLPSWSSRTAGATTGYSYDRNLSTWVRNTLESASLGNGGTGLGTKRTPKVVYVRCYSNRTAFENTLLRMGDTPYDARMTVAYYVPPRYAGGDASTVNMRAGTCNLAHEFTAAHVTQATAGAFHTLLHESLHRQGYRDERETEMYAIHSMEAAGTLVEYGRRIEAGWPANVDTWAASTSAGQRAKRLAWLQSQQQIATSYHTAWNMLPPEAVSWADGLAAKGL